MTAALNIESLAWTLTDLGVALQELGLATRLLLRSTEAPRPPEVMASAPMEVIDHWIDRAAGGLGLEAEPVECSYSQVETFIERSGPALLRIVFPSSKVPRFLALLPGRANQVRVLTPELKTVKVPVEAVRHCLCRALEEPWLDESRNLLQSAGVAADRVPHAIQVLLRERLGEETVGNAWLLRLHPGSDFGRQVSLAGLPRRIVELGFVHAISVVLMMLAWWIIGRAALSGHIDIGYLMLWALLLPTTVPFDLLTTWLQGQISLHFGSLMKQRLLAGALRLDPNETRSLGSGQILGRVIESNELESLALSGGFSSLMAGVELFLAALVLARGTSGGAECLLQVAWLVMTGGMARRYYNRRRNWTLGRLELTHDLVETMVGQPTRLVQEQKNRWHLGEDDALERYLRDSQGMDRAMARLMALIPRGGLTLGVLALSGPFVAGTATPAELAIGLGGLLLSYRALGKLVMGLSSLVDASIAWEQITLLFDAAGRPQEIGAPEFAVTRDLETARPGASDIGLLRDLGIGFEMRPPPLVEAHDLSYRYPTRPTPVIRGLSLKIERGERILLGGRSGGGKSSLASLLCGIRKPESGLLMLEGLDRQTLGHEGWRKSIVLVPQFHENYVVGNTMAFNLLMGRRWPPTQKDMMDANEICQELGLGALLDRMPGGLMQMIGESGWQLSHGERGRLFMARSLLQDADLIIMDEAFAALDPENLARCMQCVLKRAVTLIVIAHP